MSVGVNKQERTIAIVLGASRFPRHALWGTRETFLRSASKVKEYLTSADGLGVVPGDLLDLFDDPESPMEQRDMIEEFLVRNCEMPAPPQNLLLYYVGHGCFTDDQRFGFALQCTKRDAYNSSTLLGRELAGLLRNHAPFLRRFLVLDCCFAAQLYGEFLSTPGQALAIQIEDELPATEGTALLCASSKDSPAKAREEWDYTMFGGAFLRAVQTGNQAFGQWMSFRDIERLCRQIIRAEHPDDFVRPELHTPSAEHGDVAGLPLFPNPAWAAREAERKRQATANRRAEARQQARQAEDARMVEEARLASLEADRARTAEDARIAEQASRAEQARLAEEARVAAQAHDAQAAEQARRADVARQAQAAKDHSVVDRTSTVAAGGTRPRKPKTAAPEVNASLKPTHTSLDFGGYAGKSQIQEPSRLKGKKADNYQIKHFVWGLLWSLLASDLLAWIEGSLTTPTPRMWAFVGYLLVVGFAAASMARRTRSTGFVVFWWVPYIAGWYCNTLGSDRPPILLCLVAAFLLGVSVLVTQDKE